MSFAGNFGHIPRFLFNAKTPPPCSRVDPKFFFAKDFFIEPDSLMVSSSFYENESFAKAVCYDCPLKLECFLFAVESNQHGIWGGTNEKERSDIRRGRGAKIRSSLGLPPVTRRDAPRKSKNNH